MKRLAVVCGGLLALAVSLVLAARVLQPWDPSAAPGGQALDSRGPVPPRDMNDFVSTHELIVEGTTVSFVEVGLSSGWPETGTLATVTPPPGASGDRVDASLPFSDLVITVDRVHLNRSPLPVDVGSRLRVRGFGWGPGSCDATPAPDLAVAPVVALGGSPGDRYLYGLVANPDAETWDLKDSVFGRISLRGPRVTDSNCPPGPVGWSRQRNPRLFLAELSAAIAGGPPPGPQ